MGTGEPVWCPTLRPTRAEFSRPFVQYVEEAFRAHPDAPMLKIVPPKGYIPRTDPFPPLDQLRISTPIKQHVFGTKGAYRCVLEEQRGMSVADFKKLAYREDHQTPRQGHRDDALLERAFWSSITLSPPYYGADTPCSFFDEHLRFGWNLRGLKCLLSEHDVPDIPGVTTPMTYFGMWKSFFSWHIEDVDLYSINYLHFGAPKVWYSVSPADREKFENMAKQLYPELARNCESFLRHKDILISPRVLRAFNVPFQQARQEAGEFVVLNAAAYHSGFNQGFNCAEAVNFALPDWLPLGRHATRCACSALDDAVRLDMRVFKPEGEVWSEWESSSDEEDDSDEDADSSDADSSEEEEEDAEDAESSEAETDSAASTQTNASEGHATGSASASGRPRRPVVAPKRSTSSAAQSPRRKPVLQRGMRGRPRKDGSNLAAAGGRKRRISKAEMEESGGVDMVALNALMPHKMGRPFKSPESAAKAGAKLARKAVEELAEASQASPKRGRPFRNPDNEAKHAAKKAELIAELSAKVRQAKKFAAAAAAAAAQAKANRAAAAAEKSPSKRASQAAGPKRVNADNGEGQLSAKRQRLVSGTGRVRTASLAAIEAAETPPARRASTKRATGGPHRSLGGGCQAAVKSEWPHVQDNQPMVIVGQDAAGTKYFYMVQKVEGTEVSRDGVVSLQWLAQGKDHLYRPTPGVYQEKVGALIGVKTEWLPPRGGRREGGYKLLTERDRILDTELVD